MRKIAIFYVFLALLVQFSPSIHLLSPHEHDAGTEACKHGTTQVHFEASPALRGDAPCQVCANLLNRQVLLEAVSVRCQLTFAPAVKPAPLPVNQDTPALQHPDTRGPPHTL
jgi:hypothetical protein